MNVQKILGDGSHGRFTELFEGLRDAVERSARREGEKPQTFPSPEVLVLTFLMRRNIKDLHSESGLNFNIITTQMPRSYLPCTKSVNELTPILIKDLSLETHHRGHKIFFRVLTAPDRINAVMSVVEDISGLAVLLQLYKLPEESVMPSEETIWERRICVLKEPFFKCAVDGSYNLRVDHVHDILWLADDDDRVPAKWRASHQRGKKVSLGLRNVGNVAVKGEKWAEAARLYTFAIQAAVTPEESQLARLNRSLANLKLGRLEDALSDASGQGQATLENGLFREGRALYELGRFKESLDKLLAIPKMSPNKTAYKAYALLAKDRLAEDQHGKYLFSRMYRQALEPNPIIDCATFPKPVEIRPSPGRGRGLFTTQAVRAGELLLCEKAFAYRVSEPSAQSGQGKITILMQLGCKTGYVGGQSQLITDLVMKLQHSPIVSRAFLDLHHGGYEATPIRDADGRPVVETFLVMKTVTANCFGAPRTTLETFEEGVVKEKSAFSTCGIWILASHINHSCIGNCHRSFIGDMMVVRATRDMPKGTELMFPYKSASPYTTYEEAQKEIDNWGFQCGCNICVDKKNTVKKNLIDRKALHDCLGRYFNSPEKSTLIHAKGAVGVLGQLEATYAAPVKSADKDAQEPFAPRLALWDGYFATGGMFLSLNMPNEAVAMTVKGLEALGFDITAPPARGGQQSSGPTALKVKSWGMSNEHGPRAFMTLLRAYRSTRSSAADSVKKYVVTSYEMMVGESESVLLSFPDLD